MSSYNPAQPLVLIATGTIETMQPIYSWATFLNDGAADGTIDFGAGNIVTLKNTQSITLPYLGRGYGETIVDGTGTVMKVVYVR